MTCTPATLDFTRAAATSALGLPTSFNLQQSSNTQGKSNLAFMKKFLLDCAPEKELSIQVRDINCIHVNHIYVAKTGQRQVLQQLTAKTTSTHAEYSTAIVQKLPHSRIWLKFWTCDIARSVQKKVQVLPSPPHIHLLGKRQMVYDQSALSTTHGMSSLKCTETDVRCNSWM